jgi:hypothetical protein
VEHPCFNVLIETLLFAIGKLSSWHLLVINADSDTLSIRFPADIQQHADTRQREKYRCAAR